MEAEVIAFNANKCMCCWGWDIKAGKDTIRTESIIVGDIVGYQITSPIKVYIEPGEKNATCSSFVENRIFYEIKNIKRKQSRE